MLAVECDHVNIRYITGDMKSIGLKEYCLRHITGNYHVKEFYADKNITFSLEQGDMLGIIGSNGAGKSTLLKAISGILIPTGGTIRTHGKIAALLELASGFDADMTVRENTYLRGAMLGYTKKFLDEKYDEIIAFAELEKFQDYYFKQLSSGMKSRLAFSIACLVNPKILILDEFGYVPYDRIGSQLLFDYLSEIHEQKSVVLNTNLEFSQWVNVLYDKRMTTALIGRLIQHVELILFPGENNRLRESSINQAFARTNSRQGVNV